MSWGINPGELTAADREALGLDELSIYKEHARLVQLKLAGSMTVAESVELMQVRERIELAEDIDALEWMRRGYGLHADPRDVGDNSLSRKVVRSGCLECTTKERPKPYTRVASKGHRMSKKGRLYYDSQRKLAAYMRAEMMSDADVMKGESSFWDTPFMFGLAIDVPVTARGEIPRNAGDYDNYIKAWMDAGQWDTAKLFMDDSLRLYRGPCQIRPVPVMPSADGLWRFFWRVETI